MPKTGLFDVEDGLKKFAERKAANAKITKVDNHTLKDGEMLVFYCTKCGAECSRIPVHTFQTPKKVCDQCAILVRHQLIF